MTRLTEKVSEMPGWARGTIALIPLLLFALAGVPLAKASLWLFEAVTLIVMAWVMVLSVIWWRGLDEASQEAHKFAWFWGGFVGLALAAVVVLAIPVAPPLGDLIENASLSLRGRSPGTAGFLFGIVFTLLLLAAGYLVVWVGWWAAMRKPR